MPESLAPGPAGGQEVDQQDQWGWANGLRLQPELTAIRDPQLGCRDKTKTDHPKSWLEGSIVSAAAPQPRPKLIPSAHWPALSRLLQFPCLCQCLLRRTVPGQPAQPTPMMPYHAKQRRVHIQKPCGLDPVTGSCITQPYCWTTEPAGSLAGDSYQSYYRLKPARLLNFQRQGTSTASSSRQKTSKSITVQYRQIRSVKAVAHLPYQLMSESRKKEQRVRKEDERLIAEGRRATVKLIDQRTSVWPTCCSKLMSMP
ncbi:transcription activator BRG1 isoform X1 [Lates japonicus]|uniref:Transcription activator BRG1 isoform X1 n=1 Tax=Lates japonicus TaxID=270547 RepID=A0AAD3N466_LATJO|nr:transcription activator BRG1 isoform X1 [Lates japonicus]